MKITIVLIWFKCYVEKTHWISTAATEDRLKYISSFILSHRRNPLHDHSIPAGLSQLLLKDKMKTSLKRTELTSQL